MLKIGWLFVFFSIQPLKMLGYITICKIIFLIVLALTIFIIYIILDVIRETFTLKENKS